MEHRRFEYQKLVRDYIPSHMREEGGVPVLRELTPDEHAEALAKKAIEESSELEIAVLDTLAGADTRGEVVDGLADLREVLECLAKALGITDNEIVESQTQKRERYGSFNDGLFIETTAVPLTSSWLPHLEQNSDRYPEITD